MAQITITIPDDLLAVHQRFQQENGAFWLDAYIVAKLEELKRRFDATDQQRFEQDDLELFRLKFAPPHPLPIGGVELAWPTPGAEPTPVDLGSQSHCCE